METKSQVTAALKKLGPSKPREIADHAGLDPQVLKKTLKALLAAGEVKARGKTAGRVYALSGQDFGEEKSATPPLRRKKRRKTAKGRKKRKSAIRRPRAAASLAGEFIAGVMADGGVVIVGHSPAPLIFSPAQALKLADLFFRHFEP